jgi:hypothetical protein
MSELESFRPWMIGGEAATSRKKAAEQLEAKLDKGDFDHRELETINHLLAHELLCWENAELQRREAEQGIQRTRPPWITETALKRAWTTSFCAKLSERLSDSIHQSPQLEWELQARGIVISLKLLKRQGSRELKDTRCDQLKKNFAEHFQALQRHPPQEGALSKEVAHQHQCAYLLVLGAEYAKQFQKAKPPAVLWLERSVGLVSLIFSMASISWVGPCGSLPRTSCS